MLLCAGRARMRAREAVRAALFRDGGDKTKALWTESLANPGGIVSDLDMLAELADSALTNFKTST